MKRPTRKCGVNTACLRSSLQFARLTECIGAKGQIYEFSDFADLLIRGPSCSAVLDYLGVFVEQFPPRLDKCQGRRTGRKPEINLACRLTGQIEKNAC